MSTLLLPSRNILFALHRTELSLTSLRRRSIQILSTNTMSFSRLVRFLPADSSSQSSPLIGEPVDAELDVGLATYSSQKVEINLFSGRSVLSPGSKTGEKVTLGKLLSPLAKEEVGTIRCIGLNVSDSHIIM